MSKTLSRTLRTILQLLVAISGSGLVALVFDLGSKGYGIATAILLVFTTVIQNALEDSGKIPAVFESKGDKLRG